eukprot:CAMPEP_0172519226 /NCGR_PEP_ID=MMETSP1066-20121228/291290_1 /TAXON_ID=671091 /ORGANISM="Coscinodiscus wailesii, Strain CCMP2513" /LENGTH=83 /DNA_ID=CAMNT_0013301771 /DNA_START=711 /DNA_END=958 /DNA_ORIENTATION=+
MAMKMADGELAQNASQNADAFAKHFSKILNLSKLLIYSNKYTNTLLSSGKETATSENGTSMASTRSLNWETFPTLTNSEASRS